MMEAETRRLTPPGRVDVIQKLKESAALGACPQKKPTESRKHLGECQLVCEWVSKRERVCVCVSDAAPRRTFILLHWEERALTAVHVPIHSAFKCDSFHQTVSVTGERTRLAMFSAHHSSAHLCVRHTKFTKTNPVWPGGLPCFQWWLVFSLLLLSSPSFFLFLPSIQKCCVLSKRLGASVWVRVQLKAVESIRLKRRRRRRRNYTGKVKREGSNAVLVDRRLCFPPFLKDTHRAVWLDTDSSCPIFSCEEIFFFSPFLFHSTWVSASQHFIS